MENILGKVKKAYSLEHNEEHIIPPKQKTNTKLLSRLMAQDVEKTTMPNDFNWTKPAVVLMGK